MDSLQLTPLRLRNAAILLGLLGVLFLVVWLAPPNHLFEGVSKYQSVHLPLETISIVISMLVFGVAWNAYSKERAGNVILLACALLAVGLIDFAHMLSFAGMPDWVTPANPEKAINFWLAARLLFSFALLAVALRGWKPLSQPRKRYYILAAALATSALAYWVGLYYQQDLPHTFIPGQGLTPLKIGAEYFIVVLLAVSAVIFWRQTRSGKPREAVGLFSVASITALSELCFTLYSDVTDIFNLLGHIYKIVAYIILYRTVFIGSVQEPFLRVLKTEGKLRHANRALHTLSAGNRTLIHAQDEQGLLDAMCRAAVEKGGYLLAWVGYADQGEDKPIRVMASHAVQPGYVEALQVSWDTSEFGKGPSGHAIRNRETYICQDIATDPDFAPWRERALHYGYRSCISIPLKDNGAVLGTLALYAATPDAFSEDEIALLNEMGDDLAFGITNLRLRIERDQVLAERERFQQKLRSGLHDTVQAIASTVERRDPYTAGHQRRVADLASAIAGKMGLSEERIFALHLAGVVHDLGKISIPAEILSKPTRLTDIEYSFIKTHPQTGYEILKDIDFPWPIAQMVLQHHERMDGSGYPQGLKGDEILLEARILAVADVLEAMASHRPYRAGLGAEAATQEVRKHRGIGFDAAVVDAALAVLEQDGYRLLH